MKYNISLVLVLIALVGCGGATASRTTIGVKGKVTFDGKPLPEGVIQFEPKDGKGAPASAKIFEGSYEGRIEPGVKIVRINYPKVVRQEPVYPGSANSPITDVTEEQLPTKYNSESKLEKDLTEVSGSVDFDLNSKE